MGYVPDWQRQSHAKAGASKPTNNNSIKSVELFHNAPAKMKTVQRFADGSEGGVSNLPELREPTEADRAEPTTSTGANLPELREPTAADRGEAPKKFGDAFKEARSSGAKEFEWNGKRYNTQIKGETSGKSSPAKASTDGPTTQKFDDGSKTQTFDDGSTLSTGTDGKVNASPAVEPKKESPTRAYKSAGRSGRVFESDSKSGSTGASVRRGGSTSFSLANNSGKYVPSKGVVVKKD